MDCRQLGCLWIKLSSSQWLNLGYQRTEAHLCITLTGNHRYPSIVANIRAQDEKPRRQEHRVVRENTGEGSHSGVYRSMTTVQSVNAFSHHSAFLFAVVPLHDAVASSFSFSVSVSCSFKHFSQPTIIFLWWILNSVLLPNERDNLLVDNTVPKTLNPDHPFHFFTFWLLRIHLYWPSCHPTDSPRLCCALESSHFSIRHQPCIHHRVHRSPQHIVYTTSQWVYLIQTTLPKTKTKFIHSLNVPFHSLSFSPLLWRLHPLAPFWSVWVGSG